MHGIPFPPMLADTLTSCTIGCKYYATWPFEQVSCLFNHPSLQRLKIYGVGLAIGGPPFCGDGDGSTCLEELVFIDSIIYQDALHHMLCFSRFEVSNAWVRHRPQHELDGEYINRKDIFAAIRSTPSVTSLKGFRFDLRHWECPTVPSPGLHEPSSILYLELAPIHIHASELLSEWPGIHVDCPPKCLLPPSLEVLKVTPRAQEYEILRDILERKSQIVLHLRKIILSIQYRNQAMADELEAAARRLNPIDGGRHLSIEFRVYIKRPTFPDFRSLCQEMEPSWWYFMRTLCEEKFLTRVQDRLSGRYQIKSVDIFRL